MNFFYVKFFLVESLDWKSIQKELENFRKIINEMALNHNEVRQSANDHTLVHWMKNTVGQMKDEISEIENRVTNHCAIDADLKKLKEEMTSRMIKEVHEMRQDFKELEVRMDQKQAKIEESILDHYKVSNMHS